MLARYHHYEQIESVLEDDSPARQTGGGTYVSLPFLEAVRNGYDWFGQMSYDPQRYENERTKVIHRDHIPDQGIVKDSHVNARLAFLGKHHPTPADVHLAKEELELHRRGINATITAWLKTFVVFCATQVGLKYPERNITCWNEYMDWVEKHLKTYEDAMLVIKSLYISFDYTEDFRHYITVAVLKEYDLSIQRAEEGAYVTRNFVEKIVSHRLNLLRKQVNLASIKHNGYGFRLIRPRRSTDEDTNLLERGRPRYFLDWMITYVKPVTTVRSKGRPAKRRSLTTYNIANKRTTKEILEDIAACEEELRAYVLELHMLRTSNDLSIVPSSNDQRGQNQYARANPPSYLRTNMNAQFNPAALNTYRSDENVSISPRRTTPLHNGRLEHEENAVFIASPTDNIASPSDKGKKVDSMQKTQQSVDSDDSDDEHQDATLDEIKKDLGMKVGKTKSNVKATPKSNGTKRKTASAVAAAAAAKKAKTQTLTQIYEPNGKLKKTKKKVVAKKKGVQEINPVTECFFDIPPFLGLPTKEIFIKGEKKGDPNIKPLRIINLRKYNGWKLEVMVDWNNKARQWGAIHGVLIDLGIDAERFMEAFGLTFNNCGYSSDPRFTKGNIPFECDFAINPKLTRKHVDYAQMTIDIHNKLRTNMDDIVDPATKQVNLTPQSPQKRKAVTTSRIGNGSDIINSDDNYNGNEIDIDNMVDFGKDDDDDILYSDDEDNYDLCDVGTEIDHGAALVEDEKTADNEYEQRVTRLATEEYNTNLNVMNALCHDNLRTLALEADAIAIASPAKIASPRRNTVNSRAIDEIYESVTSNVVTAEIAPNDYEVPTQTYDAPDSTSVSF